MILQIIATRWVGFLFSWTKLFMPDRVTLYETYLAVTQYKFFGLNKMEEEISYSKIASVRKKDGFFFSALIIETSGGAVSDMTIKGLNKKLTAQAVSLIREKAE